MELYTPTGHPTSSPSAVAPSDRMVRDWRFVGLFSGGDKVALAGKCAGRMADHFGADVKYTPGGWVDAYCTTAELQRFQDFFHGYLNGGE